MNKTVFMITFSFLNQTLWCDPHWNRLSETISMSGNIIGFDWEIRKLAFWKLSILDLICCPDLYKEINIRHHYNPIITLSQSSQKHDFIVTLTWWLRVITSTLECCHRYCQSNFDHVSISASPRMWLILILLILYWMPV